MAVWPAMILYGLAAESVAARHGDLTTYAGRSPGAAAAELAAGWSLIGAGLLLWTSRPGDRIGLLALAAGLAWFAPDWAGWAGGPAVVRSIAVLAAGLTFALVIHLLLAWPEGRLRSRAARGLVCVTYGVTAAVAVALAVVWDPFTDVDCWADCSRNVFLAHGVASLARTIERVERGATVALAAGTILLAGWLLRRASVPARRALGPVLATGAAFAAVHAVRAVGLLRTPLEDPHRPLFAAAFFGACAALGALALSLLWGAVRVRVVRSNLGRVATDVGASSPPGALEPLLARVVGDPALTVAYWLPSSGRYVDGHGHEVVPAAQPGRAVTPIVRGGQRVAVVVHDAEALRSPDLAEAIGAAARLAVDNERLEAEARAQLLDLRASRTRIVEAGDAARRELERDLHDGAQQRLVAISMALGLARASVDAAETPELAAGIDGAGAELRRALADLRSLAHGIHPAVLSAEGLAAAVEALAELATVPMAVEALVERRFPAPIEAAAYHVVSEVVGHAAHEGAQARVEVRMSSEDGVLRVEVDEHASEPLADGHPGFVELADRLGALDGRLSIANGGHGARIRAEIPCE